MASVVRPAVRVPEWENVVWFESARDESEVRDALAACPPDLDLGRGRCGGAGEREDQRAGVGWISLVVVLTSIVVALAVLPRTQATSPTCEPIPYFVDSDVLGELGREFATAATEIERRSGIRFVAHSHEHDQLLVRSVPRLTVPMGPGLARADSLAAVLVHEFGHVVGLGHSSDPSSFMHPQATPVMPSWTPAELSELERLGADAGCQPSAAS